MQIIYLHVGIQKTGSTSIQRACLNSPLILANEGKKYFSGIFASGNHREVAYSVLRDDLIWPGKERFAVASEKAFVIVREKIKRELENATQLIISSEALSYIRQKDEIQRLKALFPVNAEIIPIIYLLEKKSWLESYKQEILKNGGIPSKDPKSTCNVDENSWVNDHAELVKLLKYEFPKTMVIDYSDRVVESFSNAIGMQKILPELRLNVSANSISKKKIFQIGFNKCGTTSIANYFLENGIKTLHWERGRIAKILYLNATSGRPILNGISEYTAYTDMEDPSSNIFGHRYYEIFYKEYPDAYFILNTRDKNNWLKSRMLHNNGELLAIMEKNFGLSKNQTIAYWSKEWDFHHEMIQIFFKNKGNLIVYDIEKNSPNDLSEFLKNDFKCDSRIWGRFNKTKI